MKSPYQIIRKPIITEKGLGLGDPEHVGFSGGSEGDQDRDQGSGTEDFQGKGSSVRTANFPERSAGAASLPVTVPIGRRHMCA